jgi:hypothetical protein
MMSGHREQWEAEQAIWRKAAEAKGWEWSPAYNGYIRADYHPDGPRNQFRSYPSELAAEDACFIDGIETLDQAKAVIADQEPQP